MWGHGSGRQYPDCQYTVATDVSDKVFEQNIVAMIHLCILKFLSDRLL